MTDKTHAAPGLSGLTLPPTDIKRIDPAPDAPLPILGDNAKQVGGIHDSQHALTWDYELGRPIGVTGHQEIPDHILDDLNLSRTDSGNKREGEMMKVASIPVVVVDKWMREGFDVFKASAKEIVAKLKAEDMGYFMATNKNI